MKKRPEISDEEKKQKNRDGVKKHYYKYKERLLEEKKEYQKKYQQDHAEELKEYFENYRLMKNYGISTKERDEMLESQNHRCAICKKLPANGRRLHVDHNHKTGKVRQLICFSCNSILGLSNESTSVLVSTIDYLRKHNK